MLWHKGGSYYGRFRISGKRKLSSLDTKVYAIALERMRDEAIQVDRQRGESISPDLDEVHRYHLVETDWTGFRSLEIKPASVRDQLYGHVRPDHRSLGTCQSGLREPPR